MLSLILLSIIFCIVRCICCGASCCCGCFNCLSCCCSSRRKKGHQQLPTYPPHPSYFSTQYHQQFPPVYNGSQVARFDASKNGSAVDEDALPAMPTWETSAQKRVENSVPAYAASSMELKPIDAASQPVWARENTMVPADYGHSPGARYGGAADEYYSGQATGFYDNYGTQRGIGDNMPSSTLNEGARYESYRNTGYINPYSEPQQFGDGPRFAQQQPLYDTR